MEIQQIAAAAKEAAIALAAVSAEVKNRALAEIAHPNLVTLGELVTTEERPFFTMELIEGVTFTEFVRAGFEMLGIDQRVRRAYGRDHALGQGGAVVRDRPGDLDGARLVEHERALARVRLQPGEHGLGLPRDAGQHHST